MYQTLKEKISQKRAKIGIIGLGRIGLPLAVVFANKGLHVIGIDNNSTRLELIKNSKSPFQDDPNLQDELQKAIASKNIEFATTFQSNSNLDVIIVTVGTPNTSENNMDYSQLFSALEQICNAGLKDKFIVFRSTMPPGTTSQIIVPYLESKSGEECGKNFKVAMCPERIFVNNAIKEIQELPEIVGGIDAESNELGEELFLLLNGKKDISFTTPTGAELAKLFTNIYRYISFALSNEFAIWAERFGLDANEIIKIANYKYSRSKIAIPGFVGGPCLSKDGIFLDNNTTFSSIVSTAWKLNESIPQHVVNSIKRISGNLFGKKIAVLGLSYKADSDDLRDSPSVKLVKILESVGAQVMVHDPFQNDTKSLEEVLKSAEIVIIATNHSKFKDIALDINNCGCKILYDVWSMYNETDFNKIEYMRLGRA